MNGEQVAHEKRNQESNRVVVTGGYGFIGSHVVAGLLDAGISDVVVVDTLTHGAYRNVRDFSGNVIVCDIADPTFAVRLADLRPSCVLHLAAVTDTLERDQDRLLAVNIEGTRNVLQGAGGAKVVYASSAAVYGNGPVPMRETAERRPHNLYGFTKSVTENLARAYAEETGAPTIGLRFFNVYGHGESHKGGSASMVTHMLAQARSDAPVRLFTDGTQRRDFVHVSDVARATIAAVDSGHCGVVNVGSGTSHSFNDIADLVRTVTDAELPVEYIPMPDWEFQAHTEADLTLAGTALGFVPSVSLAAGLRRLMADSG